jgi:hypothetical protein
VRSAQCANVITLHHIGRMLRCALQIVTRFLLLLLVAFAFCCLFPSFLFSPPLSPCHTAAPRSLLVCNDFGDIATQTKKRHCNCI